MVRRAWNDAWVRPLPQALSDQWVAELISLQELLADRRLSEVAQDAWVWSGPSFTTRATYILLRDHENSENPLILQRCRLVWKRRLPSKDQGVCLAPATMAIDDEILAAAIGTRRSSGMPAVR